MLDLKQADRRTFSGQIEINGVSEVDGELSLHAKDLKLTKAWIGTTEATMSSGENDEITLHSPEILTGDVRVTIDFTGSITDAMHGLYPCYYELDGVKKELLATQFESHHAREVFPCVDEPEAKSTFDLQLITKSDLTVLANTPKETVHEDQNGTITHIFATSPRMSTYLLAFVVGDLQKTSAQTKNGTEINVWATHAQPVESLAWGLDIAVQTIEFYEQFYGVPFPLTKCDHVALPDFSAGAMENWGLITYREVCLLAPPSSPIVHKRYVATVIAHELAHQWFGNLVTMKWWDDLWLNESFANVMEYIALDHLFPEWEIWNDFATDEVPLALERDRFKDIQPVSYAIDHPDEINAAFDKAIVYAKGSRLVRMAMSFAGEEAFKRGLQAYFQEYKYSNATGADLWHFIGQSANKDIAGFMTGWLKQPGYPVIDVKQLADGLDVSQQRYLSVGSSSTVWTVPFSDSALNSKDAKINALIPINPNATSHFISSYDQASFEKVQNIHMSVPETLDLIYASTLLAESGHQPIGRAFDLLGHVRESPSNALWSGAIHTLNKLASFKSGYETELRQYEKWLIAPAVERLGYEQVPGESSTNTQTRAIVLGVLAQTHDAHFVNMAKDAIRKDPTLGSLSGDLRFAFMKAVVYDHDQNLVEQLLSKHDAITDAALRDDITRALCVTKDTKLISQLVKRLDDPACVKPQDLPKWFASLMKNSAARLQTWTWLKDHWSYVMEHFGSDMSLDKFPQYAAQFMTGNEAYKEYAAFFKPRMSLSTERSILIGLDMIKSRTKWVERDRLNVANQLSMHARMDSNDT